MLAAFEMHLFLYFIAIASLSQASNLMRFTLAPPEVVGFWRMAITTCVLLPFAVRTIMHQQKNMTALPDEPLPSKYSPWLWPLLGGVFFFLHLWFYKYAALHTRISNAMILFSTNPLWTGLGSIFFLNQKFGRRLIVSYAFALSGIVSLVYSGLSFEPELMDGNLSAIGGAIFYSAYFLASHQGRRHMPIEVLSTLLYGTTALLFAVTVWLRGQPVLSYPLQTFLAILGLVIFPTLLGHFLLTYLLKFININWMSCGKLAQPALATLGAYVLFQENVPQGTGVAFIFISVSVLVLLAPKLKPES